MTLFAEIEEIEDTNILLRAVSISKVTSFRTSFCMYHSCYSCSILPVFFSSGAETRDYNTLLVRKKTFGHLFPNEIAIFVVLDDGSFLESMRQLHVNGHLQLIEDHTFVSMIKVKSV